MGRNAYEDYEELNGGWLGCATVSVTALLLASAMFGIGYHHGVAVSQNEAIKNDVGRWEIDPQTGNRRFVFGSK